jgi:hypothetical protein
MSRHPIICYSRPMYDLDTLVSDGTVRVAAARFPIRAMHDSRGKNPARFALVEVPGSDPVSWVAVVWVSNPDGGTPLVWAADAVETIVSYTPSNYHFVLADGSNLMVLPTPACGCGGQLKGYRGWPGVRMAAVPAPVPA